MSIRRISCYVAECDDCATAAGDDHDEYGYTLHFDSDNEALDYATGHGWTITDNGDLRCHRCTGVASCTRSGHTFGLWHPCWCLGKIAHHAVTGCPLLRACTNCDHIEHVAFAHLPTTVESSAFGC